MTQRIIGIDMARAFAILLVTWKHSMASYGARGHLTGWAHYSLEFLMQLATPIFLILFGAMLELVYRARYERGLELDTTQRLSKRSLQCYGYYCLAIIVFFLVMGTYSWRALPLVFTGFISVPYSHLLAFYTAALALSPALLVLRIRHGLWPLIAAAIFIQVAHPVIREIPAAPEVWGRDYLQHMSGYLYGRGVDFMGPSLLHGMSLVILGMVFGNGLRPQSHNLSQTGPELRRTIFLVIALIISTLFWFDWQVPENSLMGLTDASLRIESHPFYFAVGALGTIAITWSFIFLYDHCNFKFGRSIQVFGRRSLFAFGIGNIFAYVAPPALIGVAGTWGSVVALFTVVCVLTIIYDRYERHKPSRGQLARRKEIISGLPKGRT